jgi:hypothetical protein
MSGNVAGRRRLILPPAKFGDRSEELLKRVSVVEGKLRAVCR